MNRVRACAWALAVLVIGAFPAAAGASVAPKSAGGLDCNGLSPIQAPVHTFAACADPRGAAEDGNRAEDNDHYIGHDEPSVRFISNAPGSGNDVTFVERLGTDPRQLPTVANPGSDVTHYFELTIAPWMSLDVCDPNSTPMRPCQPNSDSNAPTPGVVGSGAGAAFVELQFYAPGDAPWVDNISCDNTHWCSALNIDSLECSPDGSTCNDNCFEPVNFAWIQRDGQPTGPPSPQLQDLATDTPNSRTLLMNPGDTIVVHMFDAPLPGGGHALEASERDLTTGQSGFMIASAANGFMNTDPVTCDGTPFNFEPEYSSAAANNILPWGAGPYMLDNQFEIGHFEPCTKVTGKQTLTIESFTDTFWTNCKGPYDAGREDKNLEPDDSPCYPVGDTHGGTVPPNEVTGCPVFFDAIGDLDYDGSSYWADWPTSTSPGRFPGTFVQAQPTTQGRAYPQIQFETDLADTENGCDLGTGAGCTVPPPGPGHFYPYWTLVRDRQLGCTWQFGNAGRTGQSFGGDAQYGEITFAPPGAFTSRIQPNPSCGSRG
ncbi:MAG TPA: hypothetical protein VJU80_13130 [Solirubrobacteraceae bacterium]|nr:hypothetical protein [Solirubrobacteraceae bacterium]